MEISQLHLQTPSCPRNPSRRSASSAVYALGVAAALADLVSQSVQAAVLNKMVC